MILAGAVLGMEVAGRMWQNCKIASWSARDAGPPKRAPEVWGGWDRDKGWVDGLRRAGGGCARYTVWVDGLRRAGVGM
jgi:hypothetical protein